MIEKFNDCEMRKSGLVYNSTLQQIKELYLHDKEKAGELAMSAIELVLTGQISSDDVMVKLMLTPAQAMVDRDVDAYNQKVESQRQRKIEDMKLDKIAELLNMGMRQREIGERLGLTQQTVSYRVNQIKKSYPELLQTDYKNTNETVCTTKNTKTSVGNTKNTNSTKNENLVKTRNQTGVLFDF